MEGSKIEVSRAAIDALLSVKFNGYTPFFNGYLHIVDGRWRFTNLETGD